MTMKYNYKKKVGHPTHYRDEYVQMTEEYLQTCQDSYEEFHKTRGEKSDSYDRIIKVKIPTLEGLSLYLDADYQSLFDWEKAHPQFLHVLNKLRKMQAERLLEKGLSGDYNPIIAKLMLSKHGYRDTVDTTTTVKVEPLTKEQQSKLEKLLK